MAKLTEEQLQKYRSMDREAFDFADESVASFFTRAADCGYNLDTTGFLAHPGFLCLLNNSGVSILMFESTSTKFNKSE